MAKAKQLLLVAGVAIDKVSDSTLQLEEEDFVEVAAILLWRMHLQGNQEGQAHVTAQRWSDVTRSWQGKYRKMVRESQTAKTSSL